MALARGVLADVVASQQILALAEVRGYLRREHGKLEQVRPSQRLEGEAVHEHIGVPGELPADSLYELADYKNQGYSWLNPYLRAGSHVEAVKSMVSPPQERTARRTVANLDNAFDQALPTAKPVTVYRGLGEFQTARVTPGTVLKDSSYMSTTTDKNTARRFVEDPFRAPSRARIVRITVPAGTHVLSYEALIKAGLIQAPEGSESRDHDDEREVLLPRRGSLRVTKVSYGFIDAEWLPAESAPQPAARAQATARTPAQEAMARALAYKKSQVAATMALSRTPSRSSRFVWEPGDLCIERPSAPIS